MPSAVDDVDRPLSDQINIATRAVHTRLNKLIILRLPLALPPRANDATNYFLGLLHITPIYLAFESLWRDILANPPQESPGPVDSGHPSESDGHPDNKVSASPRIHSILSELCIPGLLRSQTLWDDLLSLTGWTAQNLTKRLDETVKTAALGDFLRHCRQSVKENPHVLLAYGWVLYMALFSGGRFIRASLETQSTEFWESLLSSPRTSPAPDRGNSESQQDDPPFRFLRFDTPEDGDDLKKTFKARLLEAEILLTAKEREDVVQEGRCIFDFMIRLVSDLDEACGTEPDESAKMLFMRSRDSVVVERERRAQISKSAEEVAQSEADRSK